MHDFDGMFEKNHFMFKGMKRNCENKIINTFMCEVVTSVGLTTKQLAPLFPCQGCLRWKNEFRRTALRGRGARGNLFSARFCVTKVRLTWRNFAGTTDFHEIRKIAPAVHRETVGDQ